MGVGFQERARDALLGIEELYTHDRVRTSPLRVRPFTSAACIEGVESTRRGPHSVRGEASDLDFVDARPRVKFAVHHHRFFDPVLWRYKR